MISDGSRFVRTAVVRTNDSSGNRVQPDYLDIEPPVSIDLAARRLTVEEGDDLAVLGLRLLGDARSWWAIAASSGILDPFTEVTPGSILVIPSTQYYQFVLTEAP
jgi:nucleoid-associated protein YgaU